MAASHLLRGGARSMCSSFTRPSICSPFTHSLNVPFLRAAESWCWDALRGYRDKKTKFQPLGNLQSMRETESQSLGQVMRGKLRHTPGVMGCEGSSLELTCGQEEDPTEERRESVSDRE